MSADLLAQLDDVIRTAVSMQELIHQGAMPDLSDARILRAQAQCAEHLVEIAHVAKLRATPAPTAEQDKAAQETMARWGNESADAAKTAEVA